MTPQPFSSTGSLESGDAEYKEKSSRSERSPSVCTENENGADLRRARRRVASDLHAEKVDSLKSSPSVDGASAPIRDDEVFLLNANLALVLREKMKENDGDEHSGENQREEIEDSSSESEDEVESESKEDEVRTERDITTETRTLQGDRIDLNPIVCVLIFVQRFIVYCWCFVT